MLDLRPGSGQGRSGTATTTGCSFDDAWPSLSDDLADVARCLRDRGALPGDWRPHLARDGSLLWGPAGTVCFDGTPLRPAPVGLPDPPTG